ncbi:hypothetical protein NDU88_005699 [Pleurodeles waltl]|uniref:Uncharacterized protein n=1 Tax=Pleurodeles waltl TaxID=8319 RepID=A0AAV7UIU5_PLEWA|nr:hypothetical protein NDU88_005699 [Pleurodeles waltl]
MLARTAGPGTPLCAASPPLVLLGRGRQLLPASAVSQKVSIARSTLPRDPGANMQNRLKMKLRFKDLNFYSIRGPSL